MQHKKCAEIKAIGEQCHYKTFGKLLMFGVNVFVSGQFREPREQPVPLLLGFFWPL